MVHSALAPSMYQHLLGPAYNAENRRPVLHPTASVSSSELWFLQRPNVGSLLQVPRSSVSSRLASGFRDVGLYLNDCREGRA